MLDYSPCKLFNLLKHSDYYVYHTLVHSAQAVYVFRMLLVLNCTHQLANISVMQRVSCEV